MARTLTVYLAADTSKFKRDMRSAADAVDGPDGLHGRIGGLAGRFSDMLGPAMLGAAAAAGALALKLGVDGVQAAIADQQAVEKLTTVMENLGLAQDTGPVLEQIDAMQRLYGVSEDILRPSFQRLVTSIGDSSKALDILKLSMDVAQATGKPLETVTAALGKAYDGNTGALGRLGAGLDKAILKTGNMDLITGALADRFGGSASANADTYQGKINRLTIGFDELKESFGQGFLDALTGAESGFGSLTDLMKENEPTIRETGTAIGTIVTQLMDVFSNAMAAKQAFDDFMKSLGPVGEAIGDFVSKGAPLINFLNSAQNAAKAASDAIAKLLGMQAEAAANGPGDLNGWNPKGGNNTTQSGTPSNYVYRNSAAPGGTSVVINMGVGDPVSIARAVSNVLEKGGRRVGTRF